MSVSEEKKSDEIKKNRQVQSTDNRKENVKASNPKQYRAKVDCFKSRIYKKGETCVSSDDLDPKVWEEL